MAETYVSYDTVGKKEDISDIISDISPTKTPFTSMTGKETVHATEFKWQEDVLRAAAANKQKEGFTASPTARVATTYNDNVTQIMQDTFEVSGTTDSVSHYGRGKESAYHASRAAAALKLDLEHAFVGTAQAKVSPTDNLTERQFAGVQAQVHADNFVFTGGSGTALTEVHLLDAHEQLYDVGGESSIIMVTPRDARVVATFAAASGRTRDFASGTKLVNVVDIYVSPYGTGKVVLNRFLSELDTLLFTPSNWKKVALKGRDWFRETLAKTGDKTSMMIVGEFSLKHSNKKASAIIRRSAS